MRKEKLKNHIILINELIYNFPNKKEIYELKLKEKKNENEIKLPSKVSNNILISFILKTLLKIEFIILNFKIFVKKISL